ncbi:MAG: dihydroneopterin aldolase [Brockia lithotrophica]|nr:dihydroneopterin aldolase [Brockia lithotrophica]
MGDRPDRPSDPWASDAIFLRGLLFYAHHGVRSEERVLGQRFRVDVELFLSLREAGKSDRLRDTLDYSEVYAVIAEVVERTQARLLEKIADTIALSVLRRFPRVEGLVVVLEKLSPPIPGAMEAVGVRIARTRSDFASELANSAASALPVTPSGGEVVHPEPSERS